MFKQSSYIPPGAILPNMPVRVPHLAMPQPVLFKFNVDNDKKINTDNLTDQAKKYIDEKIASLSISGATIDTDKIKQEVIDTLKADITTQIKDGCKCGKDDLKSVVQEIMSESYEGRIKQNEDNIKKLQTEIKQNIEGFNQRLLKLQTQDEAQKLLQEFQTFTQNITAQLNDRDSVINKEIQAKLAEFQKQLQTKLDEYDQYIEGLISNFEDKLTQMEEEFKLPDIDKFETEVGTKLQQNLQQFIDDKIMAFIREQRVIISSIVDRAEKKLVKQNETYANSLLQLFEGNKDVFFTTMHNELKRIKQDYGEYAVSEIERIVEQYNQDTLQVILQDFNSKVDAINTRLQNAISPEDLAKLTQDIADIKSQFETEVDGIKTEAKQINTEFRQLNRQVKDFNIEDKLKKLRKDLEGMNNFMGEELARLTGEVTRAQQSIDAAKQSAENSAQAASSAAQFSIQSSKEIESLLKKMRQNDKELEAMISKSRTIHHELAQLKLGLKQFEQQLTGQKYTELLAKIDAIDKKHSRIMGINLQKPLQLETIPEVTGLEDLETRITKIETTFKERNALLKKQIIDRYALLHIILIREQQRIIKTDGSIIDDSDLEIFNLIIENENICKNIELLNKLGIKEYDENNLIQNENILYLINEYYDLIYNYLHSYILIEIEKIVNDIYQEIKPEYEQLKERHESLYHEYLQLYDIFWNTKEKDLEELKTQMTEISQKLEEQYGQQQEQDKRITTLETSEFKNAEVISKLEELKQQLQEQITSIDTKLQQQLREMLRRVDIVEQTNTIDFSVYQRLNTILLIMQNIQHGVTKQKLDKETAERLNTELETVIRDINTIKGEGNLITNVFIQIYIIMILQKYNAKYVSFSVDSDSTLIPKFKEFLKQLYSLLPPGKKEILSKNNFSSFQQLNFLKRAAAATNKYEIMPNFNIQKGGASNYLMFAKSICSSF